MIDIKQLTVEKVENIIGVMPMKVPYVKADVSFIKHVQLFDDNKYHINIHAIKAGSLIIKASVSVYFDTECPDYATIYDLYAIPTECKKGYATQLILEAEKAIKKLGFRCSNIQVKNGSWMLGWYQRLGYIVGSIEDKDNVQLYKELNNNN